MASTGFFQGQLHVALCEKVLCKCEAVCKLGLCYMVAERCWNALAQRKEPRVVREAWQVNQRRLTDLSKVRDGRSRG